jgi:hypothetical protein
MLREPEGFHGNVLALRLAVTDLRNTRVGAERAHFGASTLLRTAFAASTGSAKLLAGVEPVYEAVIA